MDTYFAVGIDECLPIDAPDALESADIEGILRAAIAGAFNFEFTLRFLVRLGFFQCSKLAFGENQALLCHLGIQRLEPELHGAEVIA